MRFKGKIVWVTGTSSDLGEALTKAFHQAGANLAISGRRRNELARVIAECKKNGFLQASQYLQAKLWCYHSNFRRSMHKNFY